MWLVANPQQTQNTFARTEANDNVAGNGGTS